MQESGEEVTGNHGNILEIDPKEMEALIASVRRPRPVYNELQKRLVNTLISWRAAKEDCEAIRKDLHLHRQTSQIRSDLVRMIWEIKVGQRMGHLLNLEDEVEKQEAILQGLRPDRDLAQALVSNQDAVRSLGNQVRELFLENCRQLAISEKDVNFLQGENGWKFSLTVQFATATQLRLAEEVRQRLIAWNCVHKACKELGENLGVLKRTRQNIHELNKELDKVRKQLKEGDVNSLTTQLEEEKENLVALRGMLTAGSIDEQDLVYALRINKSILEDNETIAKHSIRQNGLALVEEEEEFKFLQRSGMSPTVLVGITEWELFRQVTSSDSTVEVLLC